MYKDPLGMWFVLIVVLSIVPSLGQEMASETLSGWEESHLRLTHDGGQLVYHVRPAGACCKLLVFINKRLTLNELICNETEGVHDWSTLDECDSRTEEISAYAVLAHEQNGTAFQHHSLRFTAIGADTERQGSCSARTGPKRWIRLENQRADDEAEGGSTSVCTSEDSGEDFLLQVELRVFSAADHRYAFGVLTTLDCLLMIFLDEHLLVARNLDNYSGNATLYRDKAEYSRVVKGMVRFRGDAVCHYQRLHSQLKCASSETVFSSGYRIHEEDLTPVPPDADLACRESRTCWQDVPRDRPPGWLPEQGRRLSYGFKIAGGEYFGPPAKSFYDIVHGNSFARSVIINQNAPILSEHPDKKEPAPALEALRFIIVTPARNCATWIRFTVESVLAQSYRNWELIVTDDHSSDGTGDVAIEASRGDERVRVIVNEERKGALYNTINAIAMADPQDDDVIVVVDGDDWFAHPNALALVARKYEEGAWMTYGTFIEYPTGLVPDWIVDFPKWVIDSKSFRRFPFISSHLRTFKYFLLKDIEEKSFCYDEDHGWGPKCSNGGRYFDRAGADVAVMLPLLERAGERIMRVDSILLVYNIATPSNDYKIHLKEQWGVDELVRSRQPLSRKQGSRRSPSSEPPSIEVLTPVNGASHRAQEELHIEYRVGGVWVPEEAVAEVDDPAYPPGCDCLSKLFLDGKLIVRGDRSELLISVPQDIVPPGLPSLLPHPS
uniref:Glycosyltransferase 2-like domain-containing protein n=1 Tax=Guillardia theta TaxID=55529 RepID=A0A6U5VIX4_GUITH|mmetsp:Transcript_10460/g.34940  ORF Transcript_10460/g.34940 Transcript_10460/m.34940 type:complete len:723 (+) Transcript_10460:41-2209(+)